jgi:phospholipid/cholesterol/gamma-HCH transport system substrate-binding protein
MANSASEIAIGAVVLTAAAGFLFFASGIVGGGNSDNGVELKAQFRSVEGISVGTDVRLAGVKIGSVSSISLSPETYLATTEFEIDKMIGIPDDSAVSIESEGLLGGSFVEIIPGASEFMLKTGGEIEDTQSSVSLLTLLMKFVSGGSE